jgi:hypothetical protein
VIFRGYKRLSGVRETDGLSIHHLKILKLRFTAGGCIALEVRFLKLPVLLLHGLTCPIDIPNANTASVDNALRKERWHLQVVFTFPQAVDPNVHRPLSVAACLSDRITKVFVAALVHPANSKAAFSAIDVCYEEIRLDLETCST